MYVRTPILSVALTTVPDIEMLNEHWSTMPKSDSLSFERFMDRMSMERDQYNMVSIAQSLDADVRSSTYYPPVASKIAAIGIVMSIPAADGTHVTVQRAYHGANEGRSIEALARIFLSPINGTDMAAPPFTLAPKTSKYPTVVVDSVRSADSILVARAARYAFSERMSAPANTSPNGRFISEFLREWYDDSDKWSQSRPNYRMKYNPYVVDATTILGAGNWSGDIDLAGRMFGLDASSRPKLPARPASENPSENELLNAGRDLALESLWRARRSMEIYCIQSDIVNRTNYIETLLPSLSSVPLTPEAVPDSIKGLRERYAEVEAAGQKPVNIAVLRYGDAIPAKELNIILNDGKYNVDTEHEDRQTSEKLRTAEDARMRPSAGALPAEPDGEPDALPTLEDAPAF